MVFIDAFQQQETGEKHDLPQVTDKLYHTMLCPVGLGLLCFSATLNNISVLSERISFIVGKNRRKIPTCRMSLTKYHIMLYSVQEYTYP